ncbi:uncharacterized protein G2W53_032980 [Senna tora]|uniref:Uncharacterized protein n=1 Tax=Senna tora TaxID=362788 RepID=A0A834SXM4_9FABA|nr:uncharacterized protein G2W53_032980 [Senna tora]
MPLKVPETEPLFGYVFSPEWSDLVRRSLLLVGDCFPSHPIARFEVDSSVQFEGLFPLSLKICPILPKSQQSFRGSKQGEGQGRERRVTKATSGTVPPEVVKEPPTVPSVKPPLPSTGVVTSSAPIGSSIVCTSIPLPSSTEVVDLDSSGDIIEGKEEPLNKRACVDSGTSMETGIQADAPLMALEEVIANQNPVPGELVVSKTLAAPSCPGLDSGAGTLEEEPSFSFMAFSRRFFLVDLEERVASSKNIGTEDLVLIG